MMYCKYCGKEVFADAVVCIHCGRNLKECGCTVDNNGNFFWALIGFFMPVLGLILYLLWKKENSQNAILAGKGALVGLFVGMGVMILITLVAVIVFAAAAISQGGLPFGP